MKTIITTLLLSLFSIPGFSQAFSYEVRGKYVRPVSKETLFTAKTMADIRPGYPSSWITEYLSTLVIVMHNGEVLQAAGSDENLNESQLSILKMAELGEEISVDVDYRYKNAVTENMDIRKMRFVLTVAPAIEAEYPGGREHLIQYLEDNAISKISEKDSKEIQSAIIRFTVTENGGIANAEVFQSSSNPEIDKLLLKAITRMPKWKPAENLSGRKLKQELEFSVGNVGC